MTCGRPTKRSGNPCRVPASPDMPSCRAHATTEEIIQIWEPRRRAQQDAYRTRQRRLKELWSAAVVAAKEAGPQATALADEIMRDYLRPSVPQPLVSRFKDRAVTQLRYAIGNEQSGYESGAVATTQSQLQQAARSLPPKVERAARATQRDGVLSILDRGHWAAGWLYHLTGLPMRTAHPDAVAETVDVLTGWLREGLDELRRLAAEVDDAASTRGVTRWLTRAAVDAARATPEAKPYRELTLPVLCGTIYGRLDVVIWQPRFPDIVVEIDSKPNPQSVRKLEFARDTGALAVWVRHGSGGITASHGVTA